MDEMDDKQIIGRVTQERDALKVRTAKLEAQLRKALIDQAANEGLRAVGVTRTRLITPHLADRLRLDESLEDHPRVIVLDSFGHESSMTVGDLVNEFKQSEDFAGLFETAQKAKANGDGEAPPLPNPFMRKTKAYNVTQQVLLMKRDPQLADRLRAEADAAGR